MQILARVRMFVNIPIEDYARASLRASNRVESTALDHVASTTDQGGTLEVLVMRFEDRNITSISELLEAIAEQNVKDVTWYRGQSRENWPLRPSLGRKTSGIKAEMSLIKRFKQNAGPFLNSLAVRPANPWDWLMLMQHHRLPTRLLDWTESPLVALYFAVRKRPKYDGALWCLLPVKFNEHARATFDFAAELPALGEDANLLDNYLPTTIITEPRTGITPIAVIGPRDTPRMYAQMGTFTLTHREQTAIEAVADASHVWRFTIPGAAKATIQAELASLKITELSLFPELDNVAKLSSEVLS